MRLTPNDHRQLVRVISCLQGCFTQGSICCFPGESRVARRLATAGCLRFPPRSGTRLAGHTCWLQATGAVRDRRRPSSAGRLYAGGQDCHRERRLLYSAAVTDLRLQGGFAGPRVSTIDRLTSLDASTSRLGIHGQRQPSTAVVSSALARSGACSENLPLLRRESGSGGCRRLTRRFHARITRVPGRFRSDSSSVT